MGHIVRHRLTFPLGHYRFPQLLRGSLDSGEASLAFARMPVRKRGELHFIAFFLPHYIVYVSRENPLATNGFNDSWWRTPWTGHLLS